MRSATGQARPVRRCLVTLLMAITTVIVGCGSSDVAPSATAIPTEVPIGGVRPTITREGLDLARERMPGGLLEPCSLPDGFELVHIFFSAPERTTDLHYQDGDRYLHVWQTQRSSAELGSDDPVALGSPIAIDGDIKWNGNDLSAQVGRDGVIEYSGRLPGGGTITVDSDLGADAMEVVLRSFCSRPPTRVGD